MNYVRDIFISNGYNGLIKNVKLRKVTFNLRGLTSFISTFDVIRGRCVIYFTDELIKSSLNCLNTRYLEYVLAHELGHCLTLKLVLAVIAILSSVILITLLIVNNLILEVIVLLFGIRALHHVRLISEYLADKTVLRGYDIRYLDFLRNLSEVENTLKVPFRYRLLLKILNQPSLSERVDIINNPRKLILKYFIP